MKVGIDSLSFYTSHYYLDLKDLASARGIDYAKFYDGLGQRKMAVAAPGEDIITLAANAASKALEGEDLSNIELLLFATESGLDYSKAAGIYIHKLLNLPSRCRVLEIKQACYSATAGLQMAMSILKQNPDKKILLIASDIARYGLGTSGESSQGNAAVAMLLTANPRLLEIESECGFSTKDAMDFWRPNYCNEAFVDGRYSCDLYMRIMEETWNQYAALSGRKFADHESFCFHTPVPKLVDKSFKRLCKICGVSELSPEQIQYQVGNSLIYNREIGNCYTASVFIAVLSFIESVKENLVGKRLGIYSYGSGCSGEFFSAKLADTYKKMINSDYSMKMLDARQRLSYAEYEEFYNFKLPEDGSNLTLPKFNTGKFRLTRVEQHKRIYELV